MREFLRLFCAVGFSCVSATTAKAVSFNCSKAANPVEHLICADARLSALDDQLSGLYYRATQQTSIAAQLADGERRWVLNRNQCRDYSCVEDAYHFRIAQLADVLPDASYRTSQSAARDTGSSPEKDVSESLEK